MKQTLCDCCIKPMTDADHAFVKTPQTVKPAKGKPFSIEIKTSDTNQDICQKCIVVSINKTLHPNAIKKGAPVKQKAERKKTVRPDASALPGQQKLPGEFENSSDPVHG